MTVIRTVNCLVQPYTVRPRGHSPENRTALQNLSSSASRKDSSHTTLPEELLDEVLMAPESVATILKRDTQTAIQTGFEVEQNAELVRPARSIFQPLGAEERTLRNSLPFRDFDIPVDRQVRESVNPRGRSGPMYFEPIQVAR
jgi:hypothetical protein